MGNPKEPFEGQNYGPTYQPKGSGNEAGNVPKGLKEGDDLPATGDASEKGFQGASLERLGDYLSNRVTDAQVGNYYHVAPGSSEAPLHRAVENIPDPRDGIDNVYRATPPVTDTYSTAAIGIDNDPGPGTFVDELLSRAGNIEGGFQAQHFIRIGDGDYASGGQPTDDNVEVVLPESILSKRAHGPGHTLYADINKHLDGEGDSPIQKRTSAILGNNRFNPGDSTPYLKGGEWGTKTVNPKGALGTMQTEKGKYNPDAKAVDVVDMMKMGRALMFASTGHGTLDPDTNFLSDLGILPNLSQLAVPMLHVETADLNAHNLAAELGLTDLIRSDLLNLGSVSADGQTFDTAQGDDHSNNSDTYGQLNSHLEPFDGPLPLGMIVLAATSLLSMLALTIIIRLLLLASTDPFATDPDAPEAENPVTLPKGRSRKPTVANLFMDLLGVPATSAPFSLCMERGIAGFYGFSVALSDLSATDIIDSAINIAQSSGYYASIMRQVVRDLEQTERAIASFPVSGVGAAIGGALSLITEFASSTSFRFLMLMGTMGDIIITSERYGKAPMGQELDDIKEGPGTRMAKSRVSSNLSTLVWRQSSLPSRYLLPASFSIASAQWGMPVNQGSAALAASAIGQKLVHTDAADPNVGTQAKADEAKEFGEDSPIKNNRLSKQYVAHIEDQFEFEYVPFYFHDLRTNEILGFHAFIESITDDYSPDYNTVSSYGRVDDVRIWKKTSRALNLTFFVAATNPDDFDSMWFDINKLTTMVYPQWSVGQPLQDPAGNKFTMPFSQIPMASPLIRLRLGDLFKTNYSRFNLARMFGMGQPDAVFDLSPTAADLKKASDLAADANAKARADASAALVATTKIGQVKDENGNMLKIPPPPTVEDAEAIGVLGVGTKVTVEPLNNGYYFIEPEEDAPQVVKFTTRQECIVEGISVKGGLPISIPGLPAAEGTPYWKVKFADEEVQKKADPENQGFWVSWFQLIPHSETISQLVVDEAGVVEAQQADAAAAKAYQAGAPDLFFGDKVNSIVRSFESSGGRGIAGHITSLSLGYDAAPWETRRIGSKAPMWVKVTMGFAPIHDIPPGLDSDGFNRAPIYNTGRIMNALAGDDIHGHNFNDEGVGTLQAQDKANREEIMAKPEGADTVGGFGILG